MCERVKGVKRKTETRDGEVKKIRMKRRGNKD